ncbi:MAG: phage holin family protein [Candidatus Gracilibacteria bacterium]
MKILLSIILNAVILYLIVILLGENTKEGIENGITLGCLSDCSPNSIEAWKTFLVGGIILGLINITVKPILKILSFPFFILSFGLVSIVINSLILGLLTYIINNILQISGIGYTINGWTNFIIAVAIFTILNMFYTLLFFKK